MAVSREDGRSMDLGITVTGIIDIWTSNHKLGTEGKYSTPCCSHPQVEQAQELPSAHSNAIQSLRPRSNSASSNYTIQGPFLFYFILEAKTKLH